MESSGRGDHPAVVQEATIEPGSSVLYHLCVTRALVRATRDVGAERVFTRFAQATELAWAHEVIGRYWKDPALIELRATAPLGQRTFAEAAVAALDALSGVFTLTTVRVDASQAIVDGLFVAAPQAPTGTAIAGLEWLHFEVRRDDGSSPATST